MKSKKFLVVEDNDLLNEAIVDIISSFDSGIEVLSAFNGAEAIEILKNDSEIDCVFCDYKMPVMNGGKVYQFIAESNMTVRFVLVSTSSPEDLPEFEGVEIEFVKKPNVDKIEDILEAMNITAPQYSRVPVESLYKLGEVEWELFVRLSAEKFVNVFHSGSKFKQSDLAHYKDKGVRYLFVETKNAKLVFEKLMALVTQNRDDIKPQLVVDVIHSAIRALGVTDEVKQLTENAVAESLKAIKENQDLNAALTDLMSDESSYLSAHSLALSYLSCFLVAKLKRCKPSDMLALSAASLLHDATFEDDDAAKHQTVEQYMQDRPNCTSEQLFEFRNHPKVAADLIKTFTNFPPDVFHIVAQHHERADGSGFPGGLKADHIYELSAIFIIAHSLLLELQNKSYDLNEDQFIIFLERNFDTGVFYKVVDDIKQSYISG